MYLSRRLATTAAAATCLVMISALAARPAGAVPPDLRPPDQPGGVFDPVPATVAHSYTQHDHQEFLQSGDSSSCLDADTATLPNDGTRAQLWRCIHPAEVNQWWDFVSTDVPGLFQIQLLNTYPPLCLDANNAESGGNGTHVQIWRCRGLDATNQLWWVTRMNLVYEDGSESFDLRSDWNGRCLDADLNTSSHDGTVIQLWDCLGAGQHNQLWYPMDPGYFGP